MKFSRKKIITVLQLIILNQIAVAEPIMIEKFEMNQQEQEAFVNSLIYSIKEHPIFLQALTFLKPAKLLLIFRNQVINHRYNYKQILETASNKNLKIH